MIAEKVYRKPVVVSHQPIQFETAHCWNPGCGTDGKQNGNNGINFPNGKNPNPTPDGAGALGVGQCQDHTNQGQPQGKGIKL